MTTRIHVVNFGPDYVELTPVDPTKSTEILIQTKPSTKLGPQQSADLYVYDSQSIVIQEKKS